MVFQGSPGAYIEQREGQLTPLSRAFRHGIAVWESLALLVPFQLVWPEHFLPWSSSRSVFEGGKKRGRKVDASSV